MQRRHIADTKIVEGLNDASTLNQKAKFPSLARERFERPSTVQGWEQSSSEANSDSDDSEYDDLVADQTAGAARSNLQAQIERGRTIVMAVASASTRRTTGMYRR